MGAVSSGYEEGYCGYRFDSEWLGYTVRFRHYDPAAGYGRWLERDPAGYVDGGSLYGYGRQAPHAGSDPSGLVTDQTLEYYFAKGPPTGWDQPKLSFYVTPKLIGGAALVAAGVVVALASPFTGPFMVTTAGAGGALTAYGGDYFWTGVEEGLQGGEELPTGIQRALGKQRADLLLDNLLILSGPRLETGTLVRTVHVGLDGTRFGAWVLDDGTPVRPFNSGFVESEVQFVPLTIEGRPVEFKVAPDLPTGRYRQVPLDWIRLALVKGMEVESNPMPDGRPYLKVQYPADINGEPGFVEVGGCYDRDGVFQVDHRLFRPRRP